MNDFIWPSDLDRAENDELNRVCEYLEEVLDEHEALAAHLERLRAAALDVISFVPGGEVKARLRDAYDEEPTTSLAHLKAEWQAEAFWQFITEIEKAGWETAPVLVVNALYTRYAELHQQSDKGGVNDE